MFTFISFFGKVSLEEQDLSSIILRSLQGKALEQKIG